MLKKIFPFRISKEIKNQPNFTKRFLWYMCQDLVLLANTWGYAFLAIAFTFAPSNYQWILGLLIPLPKILYLKVLLFVCNKSAGSGPNGKSSIKLLMVHFTEAKQCIFCAMIVGGVATSETTYCILSIRTFLIIYKCYKIISKSKCGMDPDVKGKLMN